LEKVKDLIIGGCSNYSWNDVRYWVNSIKQSGFKGDVVLVATNISKDTIEKLKEKGVIIYPYGEQSNGSFRSNDKTAPHVERFIYVWNYLKNNQDKYRYVIFTDVRDVVFQKDPIPVLKNTLSKTRDIVCASEGMRYKDEPWSRQNMIDAFGPLVYEEVKDGLIYNVGTIAGYYEQMKDLLLQLFLMSINRPIPVVDQAVFNFLINHHPYVIIVFAATNGTGWAAQLGTTLGAVEAGAGDLGMAIKQDPSKLDDYIKAYADTQPCIKDDLVTNGVIPFALVHQWDRVPAVKEIVERKYGDGKEENFLVIRT
jgi:hypothetical protein